MRVVKHKNVKSSLGLHGHQPGSKQSHKGLGCTGASCPGFTTWTASVSHTVVPFDHCTGWLDHHHLILFIGVNAAPSIEKGSHPETWS